MLIRADNDGSPIRDDILMNELMGKIGLIIKRTPYSANYFDFAYMTWDILIDGEIYELFDDEFEVISRSKR